MSMGDRVHVIAGHKPGDYHCSCRFCSQIIGELRPLNGSYYSRLERRQYYDPCESGEGGHLAKTPLHIARWAVQQYTKKGDWVLDPTIGAGTTAVEAMTQGRNAAGMELEFTEVLEKNIKKAVTDGVKARVGMGDARNIRDFLESIDEEYSLIVNNPPYMGDISMPAPSKEGRGKEFRHLERRFEYDKTLPNLAFLQKKQADEYWQTIRQIYGACIGRLKPGGHFVTGIKDTTENKETVLLHKDFCEIIEGIGLEFVGTAFLKHYPTTLHMNTYPKRYGVAVPLYQTISVFRKKGAHLIKT